MSWWSPAIKLFSLLLLHYNFATVINSNINIWYAIPVKKSFYAQRSFHLKVEKHCLRPSCILGSFPWKWKEGLIIREFATQLSNRHPPLGYASLLVLVTHKIEHSVNIWSTIMLPTNDSDPLMGLPKDAFLCISSTTRQWTVRSHFRNILSV